MAEAAHLLDRRVDLDPAGDFDAFARSVPAKWVVALFADESGRAVQLLCVKNLRYCVRRRLGPAEAEAVGLSRRINYRDVVRQVSWRRVDSGFEADVVYYEAAREHFPHTYKGMVGFRPTWFVHVDPDAPFPRYQKTIDLSPRPGVFIGPLEDKHAAARLIELAEDAFDLCRYYHVLTEAPHGRACAYKEMGKCPAPCDGSISIEQYRRLVEWSAASLVDPQDLIRQQTRRMQQAAAELRFETAAKIKAFVDDLGQLGKGPLRHARRLSEFAYVAVQRGPAAGTAKVFLVTPGRIDPVACLVSEPFHPAELLRTILTLAEESDDAPVDQSGAERMGVVSHHLFAPKQSQGVFIPLANVSEAALVKAYRDVQKQKAQPEAEGEGVMKELQAME